MSLKCKLTVFCLLIGLLPVAAVGVYAVRVASDSLRAQAIQQLESVRDAKGDALAALVDSWRAEARVYAGVKEVYNALGMLRDNAMGVPTRQRMDVDDPEYADLHAYVEGGFRPFVDSLGYPDALLIGDDGRILFTAAQRRDQGENLLHGQLLAETNLRRAFEAAMQGKVALADLEPWPGLDGKPAAFVAAPVRDHLGAVQGVAALMLPMDRVETVMARNGGARNEGMGATGRTYLVGPDGLPRGGPSGGALPGLSGKTASARLRDASGMDVLAAVAPVAFGPSRWDLVAEIGADEAFAPVRSLRLAALVVGALVVLLATGLALFVIHFELVRPLRAVVGYLDRVAGGDMSAELEGSFKAELARLARGVRAMFAQVKQRLAFAQGVLAGVTVPCLVVSAEGTISHCNQALLDMLAKPGGPGDYLGCTPSGFFHGREGRGTTSMRALDDQRALQRETRLRADDGRELAVSVHATPIYDLDGAPMGAFSLYYDLTPIREGEERVREQNETMARVAAEASTVAGQVSAATGELERLVESVSRGAAMQRERTGETAASMQEMAATTVAVAQSASDAARSAEDARERAAMGRQAVETVISAVEEVRRQAETLQGAMDALSGEAGRIGGIITVIEDIADQTNLLALNAAIEAARAGDAGRGFAVVADEVRKLAEKTMAATREVGTVVAAIQRDTEGSVRAGREAALAVEASSAVARDSGKAIGDIVDIVEGTAAQVQSIAAASEQQSAAGDQINAAVEQISRISHETAEGMERSRRAISQLNAQAAKLSEIMTSLRQ